MTRSVVVGGGISGLAGAWALAGAGHDVVVLEAAPRLGGKILTTDFDGRPVDEGPDAFLARVPAAVDLCREIGLDDLVSPAAGRAYLWLDGTLKAIPPGHVLGVPVDLEPIAKSGILSTLGLARASLEPRLPGAPLPAGVDVGVGELVRRRYGHEVLERLVDPLLGGINAGRSEELSIDVGAAQLAAAARRDASLTKALRALRDAAPPADPTAPVFYAPAGGMGRLVDALVHALRDRGVELSTATAVEAITRDGDRWEVRTVGGEVMAADRVLVTVPAFTAARLLEPLSRRAAAVLSAVEYSSVALVTLAYPAGEVDLDGSGFLVPRIEGRLLTAGSVFSNKWPALGGAGTAIIRASVGRVGDERGLALDDGTLVERVHDELVDALGMHFRPAAVRVSRWIRAFPQYRPGHLDRMAEAEAALAEDAPGVAVTGAAARGVGIPTCIGAARAAAATLV
ncbi:MAG TPA: protoporphyrinogen oxidase [Acidimicrobiales bacterium]|nr:protoporphyrinogen oxidase [Acidimicrobiales bacterium]